MTAAVIDRPKLHPYVEIVQDERSGVCFVYDRLQRGRPARVSDLEAFALHLFDGRRTLREVQALVMAQVEGQFIPLDVFDRLARVADRAGFLESDDFRQLRDNPVREPSCIGAYAGDADVLRRDLRELFRKGSGEPAGPRPDAGFRGVLVPHIDYARGGLIYTWGFKDLFERTDASLFVIVGTSHYSGHRFTLTRKHFRTPLGVAETDQHFIDRLVKDYGDGLFDDELAAHLPEHSIELEVVFLQYLYEKRRPIRIVPLLVGSFRDSIQTGKSPATREDIARMVAALRRAEAETSEPICYVISGDLAHIGPEFDDPEPVSKQQLAHCRRQDESLMRHAEAADAEGYFRAIAEEGDARRICGFPPTYLVLEAARPGRGRLLRYDQYVHPRDHLSVSFASMSFER